MKFQSIAGFQVNIWLVALILGVFSSVLAWAIPASSFVLIVVGLSLGILIFSLYYHFAAYRFLFPVAGLMIASVLSRYEVQVGNLDVRIEHLIGPSAFLLYATARTASGYRPIRLTKSTILLMSWILINLIASQLNAPDPTDSWKHVVRMVILGLIFLTIANAPVNSRQWFSALRLWLLLGALEAVYGITAWIVAEATGINLGVQITYVLPFAVPYGTILEGNLFGSFVGSFVVMYAFLLFKQTRHEDSELVGRKSLQLGLSIVAIALVLSFARGAWLASIFTLVMAYILSSKNSKTGFGRIALLGIALPVVVCVFFLTLSVFASHVPIAERLADRITSFGQLGHDLTWRARLEDLDLGVKDWLRHPLVGNGTGSFGQIHGVIRRNRAWVGNLILHTLVDAGLIGLFIQLLLFLSLTLEGLYWSCRAFDRNLRVGLAAVSLGTMALLTAYLATDGTWFAAFWIQLGLLSGGIRLAAQSAQTNMMPIGSPDE